MVRALVVGSFVMDLTFQVPRGPEPGEVVIATDHDIFRGGKGYNQAVALARLGAEVSFVGALGDDAHGDDFLAALRREGIDASRVVQLRGTATAVAVPLVTPEGDVGFVQYPGANWQISRAHVADLPDCDLLLLQGEIATGTSLHAAQVLRRRSVIVLLNPAPAHEITPELVAASSLLCASEVEARALLAERGEDPEGARDDLARRVATGGRAAVVSLGEHGAVWAAGDDSGRASPPAVEAIDTTGAGASFTAALGIALAEGAGYAEAVRFACAAGAFAVTRRGAEPGLPRRADVARLLSGAG